MSEIKKAVDEYMEYIESADFCEDGLAGYENAIFEAAFKHFAPGGFEKLNKRLSE